MDILDRVADLLTHQVPPDELQAVIATVRSEYGATNCYVRRNRSEGIRQAIRDGQPYQSICREYGISRTAINYHMAMI